MARQAGVPNMTDKDKLILVKVVKAIAPTVKNHWVKVEEAYNERSATKAIKEGRTHVNRTTKTLKNQFENILNQKKPTGNPVRSKIYQKALEAEEKINQKIMPVLLGMPDNSEGVPDNGEGSSTGGSVNSTRVEANETDGEDDDFSEFESSSDDDDDVAVEVDRLLRRDKGKGRSFDPVGEAIREDIDVGSSSTTPRSRTTPAPRFERRSEMADLNRSISRMADAFVAGMSGGTGNFGGQQESQENVAERIGSLQEEIGDLRSMLRLLLEKQLGAEEGTSNKRPRSD